MQWFPFSELAPLLTRKLCIVHWLIIVAVSMSFIPQTKIRSSPLGIACEQNRLQVAELLINNDANINYKDNVCDNCHYCFHTFKKCFPHSMAAPLFTQRLTKATVKWWSYWCSLTPTWMLKTMWVQNHLTSAIHSLYCRSGNVCHY